MKENKFRFDPINNADSQFSRQTAAKAGRLKKKPLGGKDILQAIGADEEELGSPLQSGDLSLMDIVIQDFEDAIASNKKNKKRKKQC